MVWGRFAAHGVGELVLIDGIMDQHQYIDILRTAVRRSADLLFQGRNWTFQQDNDPKHTAINMQRAIHEMQIPLGGLAVAKSGSKSHRELVVDLRSIDLRSTM